MKGIVLAGLFLSAASLACAGIPLTTPGATPGVNGPPSGVATALPPQVVAQAEAEDQVLVNVYERVSPGVVGIEVSAKDSSGQLQDTGLASGFVYDTDGHIVTNAHVDAQVDEIRATFTDGTVLPAKVIGNDAYSDLAVLKVDLPAGYTVTPIALGDSSTLKVGQRVVAIGNPFGLSNTMTLGIVSAIGRSLPTNLAATSLGSFSNPQIIQIDAAVNPGNSGGPLLDLNGQIVGVTSAISTTTGVNAGVGFAIPSNTVKRVVPQIIQTGKVAYPYLGVAAQADLSTGELALAFNLPVKEGVLISEVQSGSPADKAGLHGGTSTQALRGHQVRLGGDIIVAVDGVPMRSFDELLGYLVSNTTVGQKITITVIRDGKKLDVPVTLEARPSS